MRLSKSLLLFVIGLYPFAISVSAAQVEFHPRLTLGQEWNDNIFLTDSNKEFDWITTVIPGIVLNYNAPSVDIALDYSLNYQLYQEHSEESLDKFVDVQRANGSALFFDSRPFTLRATGNISRESLDVRNNSSIGNDLVNKSTVYNFTASPEYRWQLSSSLTIVFGYLYDRIEVVDAVQDSEGHKGSLSLEKQLSTNTLVTATYSYLQQQTEVADNYNQQDYTLGVTQQFGPRLSVNAEGGMSQVEYDEGGGVNNPLWLVGLTYQLFPSVSLKLDYSQEFHLDEVDGLNKNRVATASISYVRDQLETSGELYWNESKYDQIDRDDQALGTRFNLHQMLSKTVFYDLNADYEHDKFKPDDEKVDRYGLGAAIGFEYRRILLTNDYIYRFNDSDQDDNDYRNMIIALNATVRF